jgi:hypothetical protein
MNVKFRPQQYNRQKWLRWHRESGQYWGDYNWQFQHKTDFYQPRVYKTGSHLHYLAAHAPPNVQLKWHSAWLRFLKQHPRY